MLPWVVVRMEKMLLHPQPEHSVGDAPSTAQAPFTPLGHPGARRDADGETEAGGALSTG